MQLTVTVNLDNAAFEDNPDETRRILLELAYRLELGRPDVGWESPLYDSNGNQVGDAKVDH